MRSSLLGCLVLLVVSIVPASAEPLSCETFRNRLNGSLIMAAAGTAEAPAYQAKGVSPDGSERLSWRTPNLEGTLSCGAGGAFREFYVGLTVASKERFVDQLKRFIATNGAAICAIGEAPLPFCEDLGKHLLQVGLEQMGTAFKKQVTAPSGTASSMIQPHVRADMTVTPTFLTFSLDIEDGATLDAARQPLVPAQPSAVPQ